MITAVLADKYGTMLLLEFLLLPTENFENEGRNGKNKPFNKDPPPANAHPPEAPVMLVYELSICNHLHVDIRASALWAPQTLRRIGLLVGGAGLLRVGLLIGLLLRNLLPIFRRALILIVIHVFSLSFNIFTLSGYFLLLIFNPFRV